MRRALLVCLFAALAAPAGASAHASIKGTFPGVRQELRRAPKEVQLSFDQQVDVLWNALRVYDARGTIVSYGVHTHRGRHVVAADLRHLRKGAYTVRWRVVSGDGHVIAGVYTFGVRVPAPEPLQAYGASGPTTSEHIVRWLYFLALAALVGGLGFRLLILPPSIPKRLERGFYWVTGIGVVAALEVGVAAFLLRAEDALQLPAGEFLYGDLSPFANGTRFGSAFIVMTLGFALVASLLFLGWLTERRALLWTAFVLSLAFASGLSLSGHSAVDRGASKWSELADWVHLSAASLWAGGLIMLVVVFFSARGLAGSAFVGFARLAPVLIALLLGAGIYLSILRLPAVRDLWETGYGRVLLVKLSLVSLALLWGAFHHFVVEPRINRPGVARRASRSLLGESAVAVSILLVAAVLVDSKPPPAPAKAPPLQAARAQR
jgi:copper transport protein